MADAGRPDRRVVGAVTIALCAALTTSPRAAAWLERLTIERDAAALVSSDRQARRDAAARLGRHDAAELAVAALLAALEREADPEVRAAIVDALARHRDPAALEALTADLPRVREAEREARARALAAIDHPLARRALAAMLEGPSAELALARVSELGPPMTPELVPLLDAPASAARAARALGRIGDPGAIDALLAHASAEDVATRAAVLEALGRSGDERAVAVVIAATRDPDATVAVAALDALAALRELPGAREAADAPEAALARDEPAVSDAALEALAAIAPSRAVPALERALAGPRPEAAWSALLAMPDAAFVALLARQAGDPARRDEAADALGRVPAGAGLSALVELAERHADARAALAVALRRRPDLERSTRERALAALAREADPERATWLRAIARDERARDAIIAQLESAEPARRTTAARALALLGRGDREAREAIVRALATETDPVALEVASDAATVLGARPGAPPLEWVDDPERAAAALRLLAIAPAAATHREARARDRAVRAALAAGSARLRASAVRALATLGDRRAAIAIAARLEDEAPEVRRAAASALATLGANADARVVARLGSRLAVEDDPDVRSALRRALSGDAPPPADTCLHVRLSRARPVEVELVLPDGTWLRDRTLPTGELVVCDLPDAEIDVRPAP